MHTTTSSNLVLVSTITNLNTTTTISTTQFSHAPSRASELWQRWADNTTKFSTLFSSMSSEGSRPFINTGALCKETSSYVQFPSQSDAMIASLQLFHEVPCCIMNLIISTVTITYPDFDAKQVTRKSFTVDNKQLKAVS